MEVCQDKLDRLKARQPTVEGADDDVETATRDDYTNRVVVKFFWTQLGKPTDPDEWKHRNGVISLIRRRMGAGAPAPRTVERTLHRLVADEEDDLARNCGGGRDRTLSQVEDIYVGLLICEGHSQRSATFLINGDRSAQGLPPVSRWMIEEAEKRIELVRRRRRKKKSGSGDLDSAWSKASLALCLQIQQQLRAGAKLARRNAVGPVIRLTDPKNKAFACVPSDEWDVIGTVINVQWPGLGWFKCKLIGYSDAYSWSRSEMAATYVLENVTEKWGTTRYPMRAKDVWDRLTKKQRDDIDAAAAALAAAPPPFVVEQMFVVDQHHKKCLLGKSSLWDTKMPLDEAGQWCSTDDGGQYPEWSDNMSVKFPKEVRFHFGVMMKRDVNGVLRGYKAEPFEYTGKWVVGVKRFEHEVKAVVDKANRLQGGGTWSVTKKYTKEQLAALEGGRWEAWYIEKHGSGDGWREAVLEKVGSGDHALICVTELMQHTIDEGNRLFRGTPHENTWVISCDRLSAWWEKEAQDYLTERGFFDRQVRAWADTNEEYCRYHESVVGDRPEMCALDNHLFNDLDFSLTQNVINTSSLPPSDPRRYLDGNPQQLSSALRRTWADNPTSERIVEDMTRYPVVIDKIVEHKGGVVPDFKAQHDGCSKRKRSSTEPSRLYTPSTEVKKIGSDRCLELRAEAQRIAGE